MIQAHILYSGTVQGVGFRYTVHHYATSLDLKGWVKNLPSGDVEMLVEGDEKTVEDLCRNVENRFLGYIRDVKKSMYDTNGEFEDFRIAF